MTGGDVSNKRKIRIPDSKSRAVNARCPGCGGRLGRVVIIDGQLDRLFNHTASCPYTNPGDAA